MRCDNVNWLRTYVTNARATEKSKMARLFFTSISYHVVLIAHAMHGDHSYVLALLSLLFTCFTLLAFTCRFLILFLEGNQL